MSERGQRDIHQQTKILQEKGKFSESVNSFADMLALLSEKKNIQRVLKIKDSVTW